MGHQSVCGDCDVLSLSLSLSLPAVCDLAQPCENGATCRNIGVYEYECLCPLGYGGRYCGMRINYGEWKLVHVLLSPKMNTWLYIMYLQHVSLNERLLLTVFCMSRHVL